MLRRIQTKKYSRRETLLRQLQSQMDLKKLIFNYKQKPIRENIVITPPTYSPKRNSMQVSIQNRLIHEQNQYRIQSKGSEERSPQGQNLNQIQNEGDDNFEGEQILNEFGNSDRSGIETGRFGFPEHLQNQGEIDEELMSEQQMNQYLQVPIPFHKTQSQIQNNKEMESNSVENENILEYEENESINKIDVSENEEEDQNIRMSDFLKEDQDSLQDF